MSAGVKNLFGKCQQVLGIAVAIAAPRPPCNLPPFVRPTPPPQGVGGDGHEVTPPPPAGGGGIAPQNCTIVSQCKSASAPLAPCKNFLWRLRRLVFSMLFGPSDRSPGHEATDTGLAYAPVSQVHGPNHIVQCFSRCTATQTISVPHQVVVDCALALVICTLRSACTHHPPTVPVSL